MPFFGGTGVHSRNRARVDLGTPSEIGLPTTAWRARGGDDRGCLDSNPSNDRRPNEDIARRLGLASAPASNRPRAPGSAPRSASRYDVDARRRALPAKADVQRWVGERPLRGRSPRPAPSCGRVPGCPGSRGESTTRQTRRASRRPRRTVDATKRGGRIARSAVGRPAPHAPWGHRELTPGRARARPREGPPPIQLALLAPFRTVAGVGATAEPPRCDCHHAAGIPSGPGHAYESPIEEVLRSAKRRPCSPAW